MKASLITLGILASLACAPNDPPHPTQTCRVIPLDRGKQNPATDIFPPITNHPGWSRPVPLPGPINTAGAEDSPFIAGNRLFFFFTPDVRVPPQKQILDAMTGIWVSERKGRQWTQPRRVVLHTDLALDGAPFMQGDTLWFCSVRVGNHREIDFYTARLRDGQWTDIRNAGKQLNDTYDIGEMCLSSDGRTLYTALPQSDKSDRFDLYRLKQTNDGWSEPERLAGGINSPDYNETQPYLTLDGKTLWFTSESRLGKPGPAVFRSSRMPNGDWGPPEEIISSFAGEPHVDAEGNILFVHHFFDRNMQMLEADLYIAYRNR